MKHSEPRKERVSAGQSKLSYGFCNHQVQNFSLGEEGNLRGHLDTGLRMAGKK